MERELTYTIYNPSSPDELKNLHQLLLKNQFKWDLPGLGGFSPFSLTDYLINDLGVDANSLDLTKKFCGFVFKDIDSKQRLAIVSGTRLERIFKNSPYSPK